MKLMVIDGNSLINRAFYGIRLLSTKDGLYTNAVYGFLSIMQKLLADEQPQALCVAFDRKEPTFRHERFDGYKATRTGMPEELAVQLPVLKEVLTAMNIPIYEAPGYEADDIIGTVSKLCEEAGDECLVVTGDRDSLQLITERTKVKLVRTKAGQTLTELYDEGRFTGEYGFPPKGIIDLKALMGDSSDNIPGVAGIGEKTAMELMTKFGSLAEVYGRLEGGEIRDSVRKKLEAGREAADMSYELATIHCCVPMTFKPEDALLREPDKKALYDLFIKLEFLKMIEKYGLTAVGGGEKAPNAPTQPEAVPETVNSPETARQLLTALEKLEAVSLVAAPDLGSMALCGGERLWLVFSDQMPGGYEDFLRGLFSANIKKCAHNAKEFMRRLMDRGLPYEGFVFDTAVAAYLLDPSANSYSLEKLALAYFQTELPPEKQYAGEETQSLLADKTAAASAMAKHARALDRLHRTLLGKLRQEGMYDLFCTIEMPLCTVLAEMEQVGFAVDRKELITFGEALSIRIDGIQDRIWALAGENFNINSTRQLGEILFERLGLPTVKKTKTGYSTNVDVLQKLRGRHEIIDLILEYRTLTKLKSTYADGLLKVIGPDSRIHTSFNMTATATGRLSSTEPNLQNIPVRTELGSELRKMFVPAPGQVLVDADYSQIELRVLADIAGDEHMIEAFNNNEDIHRVTASQVFGVPFDQVTGLMRSRAKAVNFGIVYGISDFSLAEDVGVTRAEAKAYIDSYLAKYAGVAHFMKSVVENARQTGFVTTMFGRKRWLPELKSTNYNIRSGAERMAMNSPIQGSAADIIKLAMVRVRDALKEAGLKARLILQVHDELIVEAPKEEAGQVEEILTRQMQGVVKLKVPIIAEAKSGGSWYETK